ncbi:MAG: multidrug efflux SMR transporter [Leptospiraceae bacterium]|nr:multidrug efflux SMR transporter [Leptospiraceae bacterium]
MNYVFLVIAVIFELFATSSLKKANGFTVFLPSILSVVGYTISAYFLSLSLRSIPIGIAYAVWASMGIVFTAILGWFIYRQKLDLAGIIGIFFILLGVIIVSLFSKAK